MRLLLMLTLLLSACGLVDKRFGRIEGSTLTRFQFGPGEGFSTEALELYGGIAIYLVSLNGDFSTNLVIDNKFSSAQLTVPNGAYKVFAVGWDGDNSGPCSSPSPCSPAKGQVRCSSHDTVAQLNGGSATVSLTMNTGNCDFTIPSVYGAGMAAATGFQDIGLYLCGSGSALPGSCNTPTSRDIAIEVLVYQKSSGNLVISEAGTKKMACVGSVNNGGTNTAVNLPVGNPSAAFQPFAIRFRQFAASSGCVGTVYGEHVFSLGLAAFAQSPGSASAYYDINGGWGGQSVVKLKQ